VASALAEIVLRWRESSVNDRYTKKAIAIATGALAFSLFAIIGSGLEVVVYGLVLLGCGLPVFYLTRQQN
jgi:hypothetical protein